MRKCSLLVLIGLFLVVSLTTIPVNASNGSLAKQIASEVMTISNIKECYSITYGNNAIVAVRTVSVFSQSKQNELISNIISTVKIKFTNITNVKVATSVKEMYLIKQLSKQIEDGKPLTDIIDKLPNVV